MPIYVYKCENCELEEEAIQQMGTNGLNCSRCGIAMSKKPTCQAYVWMKGTPAFRRQHLGTAPYTTKSPIPNPRRWHGSQMPEARIEGEKWLESLE